MKKRVKKYKAGGLWDIFSSKPATNTDITNAQNIDNALAIAKGVSGAIVAVELLSNAAEPLLAASGVGIPLLAIIIVAKKLAKQYKQNLQLNIVLTDVVMIIQNCFYLEALIKKTMTEFKAPLEEALIKEAQQNPQSGGDFKPSIRTNDSIEESIKLKLLTLQTLLNKISPEEKETRFQSVSKKFKRFFFSNELRTEIIVSLAVINGLFTIYNSQFEWSIKYYESKIAKYLDDGQQKIKTIWEKIENSDEYKNYLFQKDETINDTIEKAEKDPLIVENFKKNEVAVADAVAVAATNNADVNKKIEMTENTLNNPATGGKKSKKRKFKRKCRSTR